MLTLGGIALFLPLIREDLHISFTQAGMLSAARDLHYALGQIPAATSPTVSAKRLFFIASSARRCSPLNFGTIQSYPRAREPDISGCSAR